MLDTLSKGVVVKTINVTVPEGRARTELSGIVKQAGLKGNYTKATKKSKLLDPADYGGKKAKNLEGFLFPATYTLKTGSSVDDLVDKQLAAFKQNFASVKLRAAKKKNLTGYDVLTIASLIEREAQVPRERKLIASVIYNRLQGRHAAADRRVDPVRDEQLGEADLGLRPADQLALQPCTASRACRRARSRARAWRRSTPPPRPRRPTTSTTWSSRTPAASTRSRRPRPGSRRPARRTRRRARRTAAAPRRKCP